MLGDIIYDNEADDEGNERLWYNDVLPIKFVKVAEFAVVQINWSSGNPPKYGFDVAILIGRIDNIPVVSKGW